MATVAVLLVAVERGLQALRRRRERARTCRIVEALPAGIRKDIGWAAPSDGFDTLPDR